jgi:hypothetical protein
MDQRITVVSGLPRSGTSLLMQMLVAGGLRPLIDEHRPADIDNPRGYLEYSAVKDLARGAPWIAEGRGRVVKVISHLLTHLPAAERYRVVLVERDLDEVLASQAKMIARLGRPAPPAEAVRSAFRSHLATLDGALATRSEFQVQRVPYAEAVASPESVAERVAAFVATTGGPTLDERAMAAAVDPSLYRNRHDAADAG